MPNVADDVSHPPPDSFPEFYFDLLWNLAASARIMRLKLPGFITAASNPELATLLGDCLAMTSRHGDALEAIVSRLDRPARLHAAELESLLGTAAREFGDWPPGQLRDLALTAVLRGAVYMVIPACELAISLAARLGYDHHVATLTRLREDTAATDSRLQLAIQTQVAAARVAPATSTATKSDLLSAP
jgi:ferritin-like metal-binding protein YciE